MYNPAYMIETHAFGVFIPPYAKYLILGSFTVKKYSGDPRIDWFYTTKVNQFWPIIQEVYDVSLPDRKSKEELFAKLGIALVDIILECERKSGTNLDTNLVNIVYNTSAIRKILTENKIEKIFFSSRFVEKGYKRKLNELVEEFPDIELITLPSPSPRYAAMRKEEKVRKYKEVFPSLLNNATV